MRGKGVSNDQNQPHANTANRHDPVGRWRGGSVSVAQGLQAGGLLDGSGGLKCNSDVLTHAEHKPNARERKPSVRKDDDM